MVNASLAGIRLLEIRANYKPPADPALSSENEKRRREAKLDVEITPNGLPDSAQVSIIVGCEAHTDEANIFVKYAVLFTQMLPEWGQLSRDDKTTFFSQLVFPTIMPYIRECLHSISLKLEVEPVVVPLITFDDLHSQPSPDNL